jgi:hypothetical protein
MTGARDLPGHAIAERIAGWLVDADRQPDGLLDLERPISPGNQQRATGSPKDSGNQVAKPGHAVATRSAGIPLPAGSGRRSSEPLQHCSTT